MVDRTPKADCYSAGERAAMLWSQQIRQRWLAGFLTALAARRVRDDHVTLLSLLAGLAFFPLYLLNKPVALAVLAAHLLLDGLDGPLARWTKTDSRRGSFTDTLSDQTVILATTMALMVDGRIAPAAGGCYLFFYTVVVVFAMLRNALNIPYGWLLRPRLIVLAWFPVELYLLPGTINYLLWTFNILLALKMLSGFLRLRRRID